MKSIDSLHSLHRLRDALSRARGEEQSRRAAQDTLLQAELLISASRSRISELESDLARVTGGKLYRAARLLRNTVRSPVLILKWPSILARLFRQYSKRGAATTSSFDPARAPENIHLTGGNSLQLQTPLGGEILKLHRSEPFSGDLKSLRVALVSDRFTADSLSPECRTVALDPAKWAQQLLEFRPHLLFVESAWEGLGGEWRGRVVNAGVEICSLVMSCRAAGIPTVFWNKEDPLHFEAFLATASLFDYVFTTDADSLFSYREKLGHDRVGVMPFAVQPRLHHPFMEMTDERVEGSFFAGAWYGNLAERSRDFSELAESLALVGPFSIYDRNDQKGGSDKRYPEFFSSYLKPAVSYEETPALYRSFRIGLSLNTIKQSSTMFARRVLELICTNTSVYSNYSRALGLMFGDLVRTSDSGRSLLDWSWNELRNPDLREHRLRRLLAMRKVLAEHTWAQRLSSMLVSVGGQALGPSRPSVVVLARVRNEVELHKIMNMAAAQLGVSIEIHLHLAGIVSVDDTVKVLSDGVMSLPACESFSGRLLALWDVNDFYGKNYLLDLVSARQFEQGTVVGKACYYRHNCSDEQLFGKGLEYRKVPSLAWKRSLAPAERWKGTIGEILDRSAGGLFDGDDLVSIDRESYLESAETVAEDQEGFQIGLGLAELISNLQEVADCYSSGESNRVTGADLVRVFRKGVVPELTSVAIRNGVMELVSKCGQGREEALFSAPFRIDELASQQGDTRLRLLAEPSSCYDAYLDILECGSSEISKRIRLLPGVTHTLPYMENKCVAYRLAIAVRGSYVGYWQGIAIGTGLPMPMVLPGNQRLLVVVNGYPREGDLYRNAFVHRRVKLYQARGLGVDVVWVSSQRARQSYEYDGVRVDVCDAPTLRSTLRHSTHAAIAVHFLDQELWEGIEEAASRIQTVVWIHGAEIQSYKRRLYNYSTEEQIGFARQSSDLRLNFWRVVYANIPARLKLVFVSKDLAGQAKEDLGMDPPSGCVNILHNPIDTDIFRYQKKSRELRFRFLSIRPHASRTYANDQVAALVTRLSIEPEFERMHFTLVGAGELWEENFGELRRFGNVTLINDFVNEREISRLHAEHGIFLAPSRGDTQGVSRDEAMSSGLVPITTRIGAIPEFVDEASGVLCAPEDIDELALACLGLIRDPEYFAALSVGAAVRVRQQSASSKVIDAELGVLGLSSFVCNDHILKGM